MKKSFTINVWYEDNQWWMDCKFLGIYGEGNTFYSALKDFIWNFKGFINYWEDVNCDYNSCEHALKMKKRYKMVMRQEEE